ncbi:right-handed parallel beta-helix repeat-containing protein [bacterium]|nr:right-handed parallel beta-helix repeat-containing protein [bacterium]
MRLLLVPCVLLLSVAAALAAPAPAYYVSPTGNDAWSGKLPTPNAAKTDGPFATLVGARDAIRQSRPAGPQAEWTTVYIRAGKYCLPETLAFGPGDSRLTFAAYQQEKPQIIGGRLLTGLKPGPNGVWSVALPEVKAGTWNFRSLFVDGKRMIRARTPNFDPSDPYRKGFAYVGKDDSAFGVAVGCIHNVGDWMDYNVNVPAAGEYTFWMYYGALNKPFGNEKMDGRTAISVDGGEKIPLVDLPDTPTWAASRWGKCATLTLTAGAHKLRWENLKGGGLDLEAYVLSDDPNWKPVDENLPPVADGKHMLLIQAENFVAYNGPQLQVSTSGRGYKDKFAYSLGDLKPEWAQAPEAEVHIFQTGNCRAFKEICWLDKIVPEERYVYLKGPECSSDLHRGDRYFVENVRDALDAPGEWYLDRAAGVLYLKPPAGFSAKSEVMAPTCERIIEAIGDKPVPGDKMVYGLSFKRLTFRGGDWSFEDGCRGYGMGLNGVIYLKAPMKCEVRDCAFLNIGKDAVCLEAGEENSLTGNDITDSAEGGINLNGTNGTEVSGNHIHHLGQVYKHNGAITLQNGASRNHVAENVVHDLTRYGITMKVAGFENVIEYNRVLNTNLETYDTGGIEVTQQKRDERSGSKIIGNIVGDTIGYSTTADKPTFLSWSIYLDSFAGGYTVTNNLCYRAQYGGIMFQGGKDNLVTNNILVDGQVANGHISNFADNQRGCVLERNVFSLANPKALLFSAGKLTPEVIRMGSNLYWCSGGDDPAAGWRKALQGWQERGLDQGSVVADPLFVNPAQDDYTLKPDSPAFKLGFQKLDLARVPRCKCHILKLAPVYFSNGPWPTEGARP